MKEKLEEVDHQRLHDHDRGQAHALELQQAHGAVYQKKVEEVEEATVLAQQAQSRYWILQATS
jgi:hypothetical protein